MVCEMRTMLVALLLLAMVAMLVVVAGCMVRAPWGPSVPALWGCIPT